MEKSEEKSPDILLEKWRNQKRIAQTFCPRNGEKSEETSTGYIAREMAREVDGGIAREQIGKQVEQ